MTFEMAAILVLASSGSLGLTRYLISAYPMFDIPNDRSLHLQPIPRSGGIAIAGALYVCAALAHLILGHGDRALLWLMATGFMLSCVSFADDRFGLSVSLRFASHGLAAGLFVWASGASVGLVLLPGLGLIDFGDLASIVAVLCVMWMTNLYNFMDGMDGFASGMSVVGFGFLAYFALVGANETVFTGAAVVVAVALGFLFYNLPPAKVFMGNVGSVTLGFLAAGLSALGVRDGLFDFWVPALIFSPFIVDATFTLMKRLFRGDKIWLAHRQHFYQRLVLAGWSHRKTLSVEWFLMVASGMTAVLYQNAQAPAKAGILIVWALVWLVLSLLVGVVERHNRRHRSEAIV
jgi:UDP-N-acetylmuramyl pentapeptide phosphotransferase/UDP-N-acetylglucosamine-1-phosphate transferase